MEGNKFAPVVLFVYNRPKHTQKVLESIDKLQETPLTDLIVFSDAPKTAADAQKVHEVRILLEKYRSTARFAKVNIVDSHQNKGLAKSIIEGVSSVIKSYGKVIVLEDDLIVAPDFLRYMNKALDFYKSNPNIWSVSAYTFNLQSLETYPHDVYVTGRGCSWGWATWIDRWQIIDWNVNDYDSFKFNIKQRSKFGLDGRDLPLMLDAYMYGEVKSWAIRWCYSAFKNGKYSVYPKYSRVTNSGTDGSGTNFTTVNENYDTSLYTGNEECVFENLEVDKTIRREFRQKFMSGTMLFKARIRWVLIKLGLLRIKK